MSFDKILEKIGVDAVLKVASKTVLDEEYGIYDETYSETPIKMVLTGETNNELLKQYGLADTGETIDKLGNVNAIGYIGNVNVRERDLITIGTESFEVVKISNFYKNGTVYFKKLWLRKL